MKSFEIWIEGYQVSGGSSRASRIGEACGETFEDAVMAHYMANHSSYFDYEELTYWGCRHYETEEEARRSFG